MKKFCFTMVLFLMFVLSSCTNPESHVKSLGSWQFQYNEETNDYSVFFGLFDKNGSPLSADVNVDIRIVNDDNEEVYSDTKSVSSDDYNYYTSISADNQYLANVRIPASEIVPGKSIDGTVFLTVYSDLIRFNEVSCEAFDCLPIKDVFVSFDAFPLELKTTDYGGNTESIIQIQSTNYDFIKEYPPRLIITVSGEKTYGSSNSIYDIISYKLYDSEGYLVDSDIIYLNSLSEGDKFRDDSIIIYDVIPGESYTFILDEYNR